MTKKSFPKKRQLMSFEITGIDIEKLSKLPDCKFILGILRVYNDISVTPFIDKRLDNSSIPAVNPMKHGVQWFLLRWRESVAYEAVKTIIEPISERKRKKNDQIWKLIEEDEDLKQRWTEVTHFFSTGARKGQHTKAGFIRNKLTAHYDLAPTFTGFKKLVSLEKIDKIANVKVGHHLFGEPTLYRNLFVDESVNLAWYTKHGVKTTEQGVDEGTLAEAGRELGEFLSAVSNFINALFISYCEKNDLIVIDFERPAWISDTGS